MITRLQPTSAPNNYAVVRHPELITIGAVWLEPRPGLPGWYGKAEGGERIGPLWGRHDAKAKVDAAFKKLKGFDRPQMAGKVKTL